MTNVAAQPNSSHWFETKQDIRGPGFSTRKDSHATEIDEMPKTKQLTISAEDRPGTLARIAKILGDSQVNIIAMNCATFGVQGAVQVVVDDVDKARESLDRLRLPYTEQDVLYVELQNVPGCLGELAGRLAAQNINVTAGYGTAVKGADKACIVLRVSDLEKAARIH